jgi:hypothetical protein
MTAFQEDARQWLDRLLHLHDTPRRMAAAFALGVFFSFSPLIGLQIVLSLTLAFLLKLNRVAVFLGLNANLPWLWRRGTPVRCLWRRARSECRFQRIFGQSSANCSVTACSRVSFGRDWAGWSSRSSCRT